MLNRAKVVDNNFSTCVQEGRLPAGRTMLSPVEAGLTGADLLDLFDTQMYSRHIDLVARTLKEQGLSFYTIGSSGHEGNAAIGKAFRHTDISFLHYRSAAFMIARGKQLNGTNVIRDQLLSLVASSADPISSGRHKVFGSVPLWIPPQTSTIASHLPKAVGTAFSINLAKELKVNRHLLDDGVVLCSFGDASLNHSTAQGAINSAQWIAKSNYPLPLVFICEDNQIGISVPTPHDWVASTIKARPHLYYIYADGLHLPDVFAAAEEAEYYVRTKRRPVFLHMRTIRLLGHAGSDIESQYLTDAQIAATEFQDPLLHSARLILEHGFLTNQQIINRYEEIRAEIATLAHEVIQLPRLTSAEAVMSSVIPNKASPNSMRTITEDERKAVLGSYYPQPGVKRNLAQLINAALADILLSFPHAVIFGEDVAKKGGVYRVTADLMQRFGQRRVFNTLLDEQTILGTAIGLAHNGLLPIPEIQYLAYLHNAEDQIRGEAATLSFFSNGQYVNPMVIRIASFAYQKGFGGHFHNDNSFAVLRDIPGVIIATPSNGFDAAKLLRTCVRMANEEGRIVAFLEPIALYMTKDLHSKGDNEWLFDYPAPNEFLPFGEVGVWGNGTELAIVTYGNGYYLSRQALQMIAPELQTKIRIVDLRWLAPLPTTSLLKELTNCNRVLLVDECRHTGSISEALCTLLVEQLTPLPEIKRITGKDTFIPLGDAWKYVLPSSDEIATMLTQMLQSSMKKNAHKNDKVALA